MTQPSPTPSPISSELPMDDLPPGQLMTATVANFYIKCADEELFPRDQVVNEAKLIITSLMDELSIQFRILKSENISLKHIIAVKDNLIDKLAELIPPSSSVKDTPQTTTHNPLSHSTLPHGSLSPPPTITFNIDTTDDDDQTLPAITSPPNPHHPSSLPLSKNNPKPALKPTTKPSASISTKSSQPGTSLTQLWHKLNARLYNSQPSLTNYSAPSIALNNPPKFSTPPPSTSFLHPIINIDNASTPKDEDDTIILDTTSPTNLYYPSSLPLSYYNYSPPQKTTNLLTTSISTAPSTPLRRSSSATHSQTRLSSHPYSKPNPQSVPSNHDTPQAPTAKPKSQLIKPSGTHTHTKTSSPDYKVKFTLEGWSSKKIFQTLSGIIGPPLAEIGTSIRNQTSKDNNCLYLYTKTEHEQHSILRASTKAINDYPDLLGKLKVTLQLPLKPTLSLRKIPLTIGIQNLGASLKDQALPGLSLAKGDFVITNSRICHDSMSATVRVNGENYSLLTASDKIGIHLGEIEVHPHLSVRRCLNCFSFDHHSNVCTSQPICGRCGEIKTDKFPCRSANPYCNNCHNDNRSRNKNNKTDHATSSTACPLYKYKLYNTQRITLYPEPPPTPNTVTPPNTL